MRLSLELQTDELPNDFRKYLENRILKLIPRRYHMHYHVAVRVEKVRSKFIMNLKLRGETNKNIVQKSYNPYLLVNDMAEKLNLIFKKEDKKIWRDDFMQIPALELTQHSEQQSTRNFSELNTQH